VEKILFCLRYDDVKSAKFPPLTTVGDPYPELAGSESSPLVIRRYFVTCKSHVTSGGRDFWERHFLLGGKQFGWGKYETSMKHLTTRW
jgi:hypothetical protein